MTYGYYLLAYFAIGRKEERKEGQKIPEFNFLRPLLTFTEVELIPPHRPLSEEIVTTTVFFTSTPYVNDGSQ